jgi:hypothetical protein
MQPYESGTVILVGILPGSPHIERYPLGYFGTIFPDATCKGGDHARPSLPLDFVVVTILFMVVYTGRMEVLPPPPTCVQGTLDVS